MAGNKFVKPFFFARFRFIPNALDCDGAMALNPNQGIKSTMRAAV
jgi:hypothetical protein